MVFDRKKKRICEFWLAIFGLGALAFAGNSSAQQTDARMWLGSGIAMQGGVGWDINLSRSELTNGLTFGVSGGGKKNELSLKGSWSLLPEDPALGDVVRIAFGFDQNRDKHSRATLAIAQEVEGLGWTAGVSRGFGKDSFEKFVPAIVNTTFVPPLTLSPAYDLYRRPWRYGALLRGNYTDFDSGIRLTAGVDSEWESSSTRQITASAYAEKQIGRSPLSIVVGWEHAFRPKDAPEGKATDRVMAIIRYEFSLSRPSRSQGGMLSRHPESEGSQLLRQAVLFKSLDTGFVKVLR